MKRQLEPIDTNQEAILKRLALSCKWLCTSCGFILLSIFNPPVGVSALIAFLFLKCSRRGGSQSTSHGSAVWASVADLWNAGCIESSGGVYAGRALSVDPTSRLMGLKAILGLPWSRSKEAMQLYESSRGRDVELELMIPDNIPHCAVYGATGSAKTSSFAIPLLLRCPDTIVVLDPKGELARLSAEHRQQRFGHRIVVLDPYGMTDGIGLPQDRINPLDCFRNDPVRLVDDARRLASAIVGGRSDKESDPYWNDSATTFITAIMAFLMTIGRKGTSISQARDISSNSEMVDEMIRLMKESDKCEGLLRRLAGEVEGLQGKTRSSVISVANSHLSFLDSIPSSALLSESTFDPRDIVDGKLTIYLCLPVDRLQELSSLQRVIMSTFINLVFSAGEDRNRRVRFLLDEAATLEESDAVYSMIMFGRSYGLRAMLLFQSVSQLDRCFPDSRKADFLSTVAGIHCGCDDLASAKEVSEWCGKRTIVTASEQHGLNQGRSMSTGIHDPSKNENWGSSNSTSYSETGRELITAAEVLQLPKDRALILLPHIPPILVKKTPYFQRTARRRLKRFLQASRNVITICASAVGILAAAVGFAVYAHPDVGSQLSTLLSKITEPFQDK